MKKRFLAVLALTSAIVMIIAVFAVSVVYYNFYKNEVIQEVAVEGRLLAHSLEQNPTGDVETVKAEIANFQRNVSVHSRLSLIDKSGVVLYDNSIELGKLGNHKDRAEVVAAFANGEGEATRYSDTQGLETYYFATKISDNLVLRISKEMKQISGVFNQGIPVVLVMIVVLLVFSVVIASIFTKGILKPLYSTLNQVKAVYTQENYDFKDLKCYDEIVPFIREIKEQNSLMQRHLKELQIQRDTIDNITKNMSEGLILLNKDRKILAINNSAKLMVGAGSAESAESAANDGRGFVDSNILRVSRSLDLQNALDEVAANSENSGGIPSSKTDVSFVEQAGEHSFRYFVSPVNIMGHLHSGTMILIMDITDQVNTENMRRDFAANVSHELKTPLTTINGFAELMENGFVQDKADTEKFAALIHKESTRLISLIDDIIRLSQIENSTAQIQQELISLPTLLAEVGQNLQQVGKSKEVAVSYSCAGYENLKLLAGHSMIYELLYNLGENAIKYNRPKGTVSLTLSSDGDCAIFTVADTGVGIAAGDLGHIFERFYRADKSRSRETGGTGLGLSIVKHIVEYYKGEITVSSELGVGSVFVVKLPKI